MTLKTKLLIGLAALTMIGGTIFAAYTYIAKKDEKIAALQTDITTLKQNETKLKASNESLMNEIERLISEAASNRKQQDETLKLIRDGQLSVIDMERYLTSPERMNDANKNGMSDESLKASNRRQSCLNNLTLTNDELTECLKS